MKKFPLILTVLISLLFVACIQIDEEVTIKDDGSGQIQVRSDMGKLFEMLKGFLNEEDMAKEGLNRALDTTILMKDMVDSAADIPEENKALLRNGKLQVSMNFQENLFKMDMNCPFKNVEDAGKLYQVMNNNGTTGKLLKNFNSSAAGEENPGANNAPGLEKITSVYDVVISKGKYSRLVNKARFDSLSADPKIQESKGMMAMMGDMKMNLKVTVPKPVKSVSNPKAILSADKKTVILQNDLSIALDSPQNLEIIIRY